MKRLLLIAVLVITARPIFAEGRAQGFIVIRDDAPVYKTAKTSEIWFTSDRGEPLVGITMLPLLGRDTVGASGGWLADEQNGRLHVLGIAYRKSSDKYGATLKVWMAKEDLAEFSYECGCGPQVQDISWDPCSPLQQAGGLRLGMTWNPCFRKAYESTLELLANRDAERTDGAAPERAVPSLEERLKRLDELFGNKLISREEYEKKRAEILKDL